MAVLLKTLIKGQHLLHSPLTSMQVWLHKSEQRAEEVGVTTTSRSEKMENLRTPRLFSGISRAAKRTEWQAFTCPKCKQLSAFQRRQTHRSIHVQSEGDSLLILTCKTTEEGWAVLGEIPHLSEMEKAPLAQDTKGKANSDGTDAFHWDTWKEGCEQENQLTQKTYVRSGNKFLPHVIKHYQETPSN